MHIRALALGMLLAALAAPAGAQTPWERYLALPTPGNARTVEVLTYTDSADNGDRLLEDVELLADQMNAGDTAAVRLAFRVLPRSDGAVAETLGNLLGRLVRTKPHLFLRELDRAQRHPAAGHRDVGCHLARVTGPEYVDREEARDFEARRRLASLKSVSSGSLRRLRDECIAVLGEDLARGA